MNSENNRNYVHVSCKKLSIKVDFLLVISATFEILKTLIIL